MKKALLFSIWNILLLGSLWAQKSDPVALVPASTAVDLSAHFRSVSTVTFDYESLYQAYLQNEEQLSFSLATEGKGLLEFTLNPLELRSKSYVRQIWDGQTARRTPGTRTPVYRGSSRQEPAAEAVFTFDEQFVLGRWENAGTVYLLEPLWLIDPLASRELYLLYREQDAILPPDFCATDLPAEATPRRQKALPDSPEKVGECLLVELALASDFELYQDFGNNATSVENFMLNTLANVQTNYDNEFADEILFEVVTTFIATCSATSCDPWTNSTNAGTLLDDFATWGGGGGFGVSHDMATLWTGRAFQGTTIGIAYLGGLCTDGRYHACENFGGSAQSLRVLWAHEMGHNFNASHDASGTFIMSPSVNTSTTWSAQSLNTINNFLPSRSCLSSCGVAGPPVAVIATPFDLACANSRIPFFDESEGTVTDRFWSFPGGNPASSTQANPVVTFPEPGVYTVSLNVDNAEGGDFTEYIIEIGFGPDFPKIFFFDGFEQGTGSWNVTNPDNNITWQSTAVGGNMGSRAAYVNNFDYNAAGQIDALVSSPFDFSAESDIRFTMEYAYRRYSNTFNDELKIYLSTNGGTTFPNLLFSGDENGSGNFATGGDLANAFTPFVADDWCGNGPGCIDLDLSAYAGQSNVVIKIENITGFGNNMYVDNVAITTACESLEPPTADFFHDPEVGCAPLVVNFVDQSTGVVSFREWTFPGGDPATSTELDPVVEYATPGTYGVTLYVENNEGSDTYTVPNAVTVLAGPTAEFAYTNNGTTFDFTNLSSANSEDFFWTFGDGNFSNDANPVHTYTAPGTYDVLLEAFSACGSDSYTLTITVEAVLVADFAASPTSGCAPLVVDFTDFSIGDPDSWEWTFSGGNPDFSNQPNPPQVTYSTPGRYSVSLTVGAGGVFETITFTDYIVVSGLPTAGFTATLAPGAATPQITNTAAGATSYSWNFGNGQTATGANPSVTYLEAGTYTITQTATNSCGSTTASQTVTVVFPVEPTFSATTTSGCAPLTVDFSAEPQGPGLDYDWVFPGGSPGASTLANPQVTYASPGDYDVSLTITNAAGAGTVTESQLIAVGTGPAAAFQANTTPGSLTVQLADLSANADEVSWDFGDGTVATNNPAAYTYTAAGMYTIELTATNACGTDVATQTITLILPVSPAITATNTNGCTPLDVTFTASPQAAGQTYAWTFPGGTPATSTAPNPTVEYVNAGQFAVTLSITNAAGTATVTEPNLVVVGRGPQADFQVDDTPGQANVSFTNQSQGADQYNWFFGDGATASTNNPTHTYQAAGDYEVVLVAANTCGADTSRQTVSIVFLPEPAIQATVSSGCAPLSVTYEAQPTGPGYTYAWTFPGGEPATSTAPVVTVSYAAAGS
ncbi:MAG: hypothetical protein C7N36_14880, partial [Bacteroidetes bacterium]